jgi:superfamily II DNA/RNA helicase
VYGGANQRPQLRALAFGADLVVATPGRLTDFVERGIVSLAMVQYLILDEADRMLDMGFEVRLQTLLKKTRIHYYCIPPFDIPNPHTIIHCVASNSPIGT